jgi:hypothetical protein
MVFMMTVLAPSALSTLARIFQSGGQRVAPLVAGVLIARHASPIHGDSRLDGVETRDLIGLICAAWI